MKLCSCCYLQENKISPFVDDDDSVHSTPLVCSCGNDDWIISGNIVTCMKCNRKPGDKTKYIVYDPRRVVQYNSITDAKAAINQAGYVIAEVHDVCLAVTTITFQELQ